MFNLFSKLEEEKEDISQVIKSLMINCESCKLSLLHPQNQGFIYRGNIQAKIAVIYEAPRDAETERGVALVGGHGRLFERWCTFLGLDSRNDLFIMPSIHCQPPKVLDKEGELTQRIPDGKEIVACFGPKTLRVLRAMPNLEVIVVLGWSTCDLFLGVQEGKSGHKSSGGQWFESSLFPGIPIFCLPELLWQMLSPGETKDAIIEQWLTYFKREYLELYSVTKLANLAKDKREKLGKGLL